MADEGCSAPSGTSGDASPRPAAGSTNAGLRRCPASIPLIGAGLLAGMAIASIVVDSGLPGVFVGGLLGVAAIVPAARSAARSADRASRPGGPPPRFERFIPLAWLLFLLPAVTMALPPGTDMAMHAGLADGIRRGHGMLSSTWGPVDVAVYPRGASAWIAALSLILPLPTSALIVSGGCFMLFAGGLREALRHVAGVRYPATVATAAVFLAKVPQSFFDWGGSPNVAAIGLCLVAAGIVGRAPSLGPVRSGVAVMLLSAGAMAVHPIGAVSGSLVIAGSVLIQASVRWRTSRALRASLEPVVAGIASVLGFALVAIPLRLWGPELSAEELAWMLDWQAQKEVVISGPPWAFAWSAFRSLETSLGSSYAIVLGAAAVIVAATRGRRRSLVLPALLIVLIGAIMRFGPDLPAAGPYLYAYRMTPLFVVATAALMAEAIACLEAWRPRTLVVAALATAGLSAGVHLREFQRAEPLGTRDEVRLLRTFATDAPPGAVIRGAYLGPAQWAPMLADVPVRSTHWHISLRDECRDWLRTLVPTHELVSDLDAEPSRDPAAEVVHRIGRAAIVAIPPRGR